MQHEAKSRLTAMLTRTGHVLVVEDFDDIAELDRLAAAVTDPQTGVDSPLESHVVFFSGKPVYPLTLAHLTLLDDAPELFDLDKEERSLCMLWVCTMPEIADECYEPKVGRKALRKWARHCPWTPENIEAILELRYSRIAKAAADSAKSANQDGALIGLLSREYGESPDYWMREAPIGVIEACIADWSRQQEAQAAAYRRSAGGKGKAVAPPPSPKFVSMRKLRECAERIEEKWLRQT